MDSYRSKISYICQNTKLFNKTVYENITYGNNKSKEDIENIITKLKITEIFKQLKKVWIQMWVLMGQNYLEDKDNVFI